MMVLWFGAINGRLIGAGFRLPTVMIFSPGQRTNKELLLTLF
jgi:hypothetical protein